MNKEIDIWQFVRIMVEAENNKDGKILLDNFGDVWKQIDAELKQLSENDIEAYADMMMYQNVVLEINREIADSIILIISSVIQQLTEAFNKLDEDDESGQDIAFEIQGLEQTVDELAG